MENRAAVTYAVIVAIIAVGFSYAFGVTYRPVATTGAEGNNIVACEYSVTEGYSQESVILKGNSAAVVGGSFWPITTVVTTFTSTSNSTAVVGYVTTLTTPYIQVCSYVLP